MIKRLSFLFLAGISISMYGCTFGTSGMWKNDHIDQSIRSEVKPLNDKLIIALRKNDLSGIKALLSDQLLEQASKLTELVAQVSPTLSNNNYRVLDEYLVKNTSAGLNNTIPSAVSGDHAYFLNYLALNKDTYVSLLIPDGNINELLVTAIYGKYGTEWKINILHIAQYSIGKKTAPDYYEIAMDRYRDSALIDAATNMSLALLCFKPSSVWQFQKADEIKSFGEKVTAEGNAAYHLPLIISNIKSKPQIFGINIESVQNEMITMISYVSHINLKDTAALRSENLKMRKEVPKVFKGIDQKKNILAYRAFNEIPDGKKKISHYGFIDTLAISNK